MKFTPEEFLAKLPLPPNDKWKDGGWFIESFKKGNVKLEFFAPRGKDYQSPHDEDEFYFIARGRGVLSIDGEANTCVAGDAFFVPAKVPHHFENFSDDFATWVVLFDTQVVNVP